MHYAITGDRNVFQCVSQDRSGNFHLYLIDLEGRDGNGECTCEAYRYSPYKDETWYACKHVTGLLKHLAKAINTQCPHNLIRQVWELTGLPDAESDEFQRLVLKKRASIKLGDNYF